MDLKKIKQILDESLFSDSQKKLLIFDEIAKSEDAIPTILSILESERKTKEELIIDLNLLLSKAHTGLEEPEFNKDGFMQKEILEFYKQKRIGHCFKNIDEL
jgi:hypothetical protein